MSIPRRKMPETKAGAQASRARGGTMYVITKGKLFVAPTGHESSYVKNLQDARTWPTREAAQRECCPENETVVSVDTVMRHGEGAL